jgi:hypothetical protein
MEDSKKRLIIVGLGVAITLLPFFSNGQEHRRYDYSLFNEYFNKPPTYVMSKNDIRYHRKIARQFKAKKSEITNFRSRTTLEGKDIYTLLAERNGRVLMSKAGYGWLVNGYSTPYDTYVYVTFIWNDNKCNGWYTQGNRRNNYKCRKIK